MREKTVPASVVAAATASTPPKPKEAEVNPFADLLAPSPPAAAAAPTRSLGDLLGSLERIDYRIIGWLKLLKLKVRLKENHIWFCDL